MNRPLTIVHDITTTLPARVCLCRIDQARHMARFYVLVIEPTLFGGYAVVREYGRVGRSGRVMSSLYASADEAVKVFQRQRQAKLRRGYA